MKARSYVRMKAQGKAIIIEPLEPVVEKYFEAFKITKWPQDLDEFLVEAKRKHR